MPFSHDHFARTRPYLFHLTDRENIVSISQVRILHSAASLMLQAGDQTYLREKRSDSIQIEIAGRQISIRDQHPLHAGNITFQGGFSFGDVIQSLNERVFFWPGKDEGPIDYGERHYERYAEDRPVILRISTAELFIANNGAFPFFCRYNSGSPRCSKGLGSPRGPDTFVISDEADFTPSATVEVTFENRVILPAQVEIADSIFGPWRIL